ncbi:MAG: DnaB-like helicase C-terminal domain-containing protein [Thermodesulfobacteriota bacterium]|nr:DnaB-like helicase C-terminal domain-containing protein [Thermodesulfobacteriota bacterium]
MLEQPDPQYPFLRVEDIVKDYLQVLPKKRGAASGLSSGYKYLDEATGGFKEGELIIVSAPWPYLADCFLQNLALNVAQDQQRPVAYFSLGQKRDPLVHEMIGIMAQVDSARIRTGYLRDDEKERLATISDSFVDVPLFINDTNGQSVHDMRRHLKGCLEGQYGVKPALVIVDYLQLIVAWGKELPRKDEIDEILSELEDLAYTEKVPLVIKSLLYPACRTMECQQHRPVLADYMKASETALIDNYADRVFFVYRDIFGKRVGGYGERYGSYGGPESPDENQLEIIVAKNPNGVLANIFLDWDNNGKINDRNLPTRG